MRIAGRQLAGLGALVDDQVRATLMSFEAGLPFEAEHGTAPTPDVLRQSITDLTGNTCKYSSTPEIDCPNGIPTAAIDAAVVTYTAELAQAQAKAAAYFAANGIAPPQQPAPPPTLVMPATYAPVYTTSGVLLNPPQTSAAPQATALTPSQVMPASSPSTQAPSPAPVSTDYLAMVKTWLAASTYGFPNVLVVAAVLGVGFYFYSKRGTR